ncbi:MAG: hypothetical protein R3F61_01015 [Myxococcota bacterium]
MAIRVRKLARELQASPVDLLGILKTLGFDRFKSPEDMLSGPVEEKLRTAVRQGVRPARITPERVKKAPDAPIEAAPAGILPGVVPKARDERFDTLPAPSATPARPRPSRPEPPVRSPDPVAPALPDPAVLAVQAALEAERAVVAAERRAIEAERAVLAADRTAWEAQKRTPTEATTLSQVLQERGLIGADEAERAIRALAESRRVAEMLPFLTVSDPAGLLRWLQDVLVLVDGPPPEALGSEALVSVAPERAEIPGAAVWRRLVQGLSEKLLLNGARRVLVVGGPIRAHRLLRQGLDARIDVRFRPGSRVVAPDAEADVTRTDAVALWGVAEDADARTIYDTGRALVSRMELSDVRSFVEEWVRALGA